MAMLLILEIQSDPYVGKRSRRENWQRLQLNLTHKLLTISYPSMECV